MIARVGPSRTAVHRSFARSPARSHKFVALRKHIAPNLLGLRAIASRLRHSLPAPAQRAKSAKGKQKREHTRLESHLRRNSERFSVRLRSLRGSASQARHKTPPGSSGEVTSDFATFSSTQPRRCAAPRLRTHLAAATQLLDTGAELSLRDNSTASWLKPGKTLIPTPFTCTVSGMGASGVNFSQPLC